jgi:hypothetical protein
MASVSECPPGANADRLSTDPPSPSASLQWDDPAAVREWLGHLREHAQEAVAAGADIARRSKSKRVRSRGEARRNIDAAWETVAALLAFAEHGLPPPTPPMAS